MRASAGLPPTRSWSLAPEVLPRSIRALVMVTARPILSSRPVPRYRLPKRAEVYQSLCQPAACRRPRTRWASWGWSPPLGPNAVAPTRASGRAGRAGAGAGGGGGGGGAGGGGAWGRGGGPPAAGWLAFAAGPGWLCPAWWPVAVWAPAVGGVAARGPPAKRRSATKPSTTTASARPTNTAQFTVRRRARYPETLRLPGPARPTLRPVPRPAPP